MAINYNPIQMLGGKFQVESKLNILVYLAMDMERNTDFGGRKNFPDMAAKKWAGLVYRSKPIQ